MHEASVRIWQAGKKSEAVLSPSLEEQIESSLRELDRLVWQCQLEIIKSSQLMRTNYQ